LSGELDKDYREQPGFLQLVAVLNMMLFGAIGTLEAGPNTNMRKQALERKKWIVTNTGDLRLKRESSMLNEQEMMVALRLREPAAFSWLFETYSNKVYRLAVGLLENETEAEGVVQDTFIRLFERLDQFEGRSNLSTWLSRVAYNLCHDRLRKRRAISPLVMEIDDDETLPVPAIFVDWSQVPERYLTEAEITAELDRAIATLPPKLKAVFMLREIEGLTTKECAEVLEISESATKVRLHRARLMLREVLAAYFTEIAV